MSDLNYIVKYSYITIASLLQEKTWPKFCLIGIEIAFNFERIHFALLVKKCKER